MSKLFVAGVLLALCGVANAAVFTEPEYSFLFSSFMRQYNKKYSADQLFFRYTVFKQNMDKIALANRMNHTYTLAANEFTDMTHEEFKATKLGYKHVSHPFVRSKTTCSPGPAPAAQDWVAKGAVTHIKNQGQCGSCWSFSTTGSVEGDVFIEAGTLVSLSEQQLVDCSTAQGNQGCNGGLMDNAFQYIISNGGLETETAYPYTATGPNTCAAQAPYAATISGYCDVTSGDEAALEAAVGQQPVSVAIEADQACFQFYSSGVMADPSCGTQLDHGVLAVGYGVSNGQKYWNVKNSWGTSWGLNGYIWLGKQVAGQPSGVCGIALSASYPTGGSIPSAKGKHAGHKHSVKMH